MSRKNRVALLILFLLPSLRLGAQVVSHFVPPKIKRSATGTVAGNASHGFVAKQQPRIHFIGASSQKPFTVHSTISASRGTISISASMGEVIPQKFTSAVAGEKKQFSQLSWVGLQSEKLPQGMIFRLVGDSGKPEIPSIVVTCAVPETAKNFRATITERTQKNISSIFLPPAPPIVNSTFGARTFDESRYVSSLPGDQPIVSRPIRFRKLRLVSVTIPLAEYLKNFSVIAKTKFRCELSFDLETPLQKNIASKGDPIFDDVYASLVANPGDIRAFEGSFHPINNSKILSLAASKPITFDSSVTGWIDQSAPYIKLTVTRTGLYRSTIQELVNRSGNNSISNWKASELRLINRGKEVSLWIDTTPDGRINAIEFYGKRLKGDPGQYYNRDTDSNAYWLTTSNKLQNPPLRYTPYVSSQTPTSTIAEATLSQHHERDYNYYPGDKNFDESQTTQRYLWISGEGFVWRNTQDSLTSVVDTFYMPSLPAIQTGKQALITASVRGISTGATGSVTHQCAIILNGKEITNASFSDFDSLHIQSLVPLSELHSGANTIAMMYRQGNGSPDQWYTDYYEVSLPTQLDASTDTSIVAGQWSYSYSPPNSIHQLVLRSTTGSPTLYNLTQGLRVLQSTSNGNIIEFKMRGSTGTDTIVAATTATFLRPDLISDMSGKWTNILDTLQGADYILITHPAFFQSAQKLALRRQSAGLRTKVVTTDEIFNAFNFGSNEPWAIRRFLQYAYDYYHGVPPALVTLFGDGTWDPKFNLNNSFHDPQDRTSHQNFVPTFGVPSSDYIYTLSEGIGFRDSLFPEMVITRIPIESAGEAESFIQKIIEYESAPPADWNRNFLFITGGDPPPSFQYAVLAQYVDAFLGDSITYKNDYGGLKNFPLFVRPTKIMRTDLLSNLDGTHVAEIQTAFQRGQSLVYFFGHGATNVTDILFPDVGTLRNQGLYPVYITLSCRTGAFAEPNLITLNESYLRGKESGVICAFGTTGFGEIGYDLNMSSRIFNFLRGDSLMARSSSGAHTIKYPIVFTLAKYIESVLQPNLGLRYGQDNALHEYSILGDAAMGFAFRPQPEFEAKASAVLISTRSGEPRSVYAVTDSFVRITATFNNFGYAPQRPVTVRIIDELNGSSSTLIDSINRLFVTGTYTTTIALDTTMIGSHTLRIKIDALDQFAETNENDNEAIVTYLVSGASAIPLYPPEGAKGMCDLTKDSVRLLLIIPTSAQPPTIEIEADTTSAFTHPTTLGSFQTTTQFFDHTFARILLPVAQSKVIWFRTRTNTTSGKKSEWQLSSLTIPTDNASEASSFSYTTLDQLSRTIVSSLKADDVHHGLSIAQLDTLRYLVESHGVDDTNVINKSPVSQIFINGTSKYATLLLHGSNFIGVAVAILTADQSETEQVYLYENSGDYRDSSINVLVDSFTSVISAVPTGRAVIVLTNFQPFIPGSDFTKPGFTLNPKVTTALQSLGSRNGFDSLVYFGSYAMIGHKGDIAGTAREDFGGRSSDGARVSDTVVLSGKKGIAQFPTTSVASSYGKLSWTASNFSTGTNLRLAVIGSDKKTGQIDTLQIIDGKSNSQADLSTINPLQYNKLSIGAALLRDSSSTDSPVLSSLALEYDVAPEFVMEQSSISVQPAIIEEGFPAVVRYQCESILCRDAANVPVLLLRNYNGKIDTVAKHLITLFAGRSFVSFADTVKTFGSQGKLVFTAIINPEQILNEQLAFNNSATTTLLVGRDSLKPKLDVVFDGHHINRGDYVASTVKIEITLSDSSPLRITDSASIGGVLLQIDPPSNTPIFFKGNQQQSGFVTLYQSFANGNKQASLTIDPTPPLKPGTYLFTAFGKDVSGNKSDTIENEFIVSNKNGIEHVMNYPNPFKDNTNFTFILRSAGQAAVKVVIYTVAGRKIRTLLQDIGRQRVGLNAIPWDGRDEAGNDVANGTYIYKVTLNGTNEDGSESSDAVLEKAVRSR